MMNFNTRIHATNNVEFEIHNHIFKDYHKKQRELITLRIKPAGEHDFLEADCDITLTYQTLQELLKVLHSFVPELPQEVDDNV